MSYATPHGPPLWVFKRDGRLVPFEADRISRALFAATESLGRPDAFLARELADGVVHFLCVDGECLTPTTAEVGELVVKVVRELGHPEVAEAVAEYAHRRTQQRGQLDAIPQTDEKRAEQGDLSVTWSGREMTVRFPQGRAELPPLGEVLAACKRGYSLRAVFTRDLIAAQDEGLLTITGLDAPDELAACFVGPPLRPGASLAATIQEAQRLAAEFVVLDSPEYLMPSAGELPSTEELVQELHRALQGSRLRVVVNLNTSAPPSWADELAEGPLFIAQRRPNHSDSLSAHSWSLLQWLGASERVRVDWHLGERDFAAGREENLVRLARLALEGADLGFVFDRSRRPLLLAEGVDRQHPAVLLTVGVNLPKLAENAGVQGDPEKFLSKLGSLARLALSAAVQKREYLRRQARARQRRSTGGLAITSGFLLDRSHLVVAPIGIDTVVTSLVQRGLCSGGAALELGRRIVGRLREVLRQDGRAAQMETCIDGPWAFQLNETDQMPSSAQVAGLTPWDSTASIKAQLRAGGVLHAAAEAGTLALFLPEDHPPSAEQAAEWLRTAWQHSDICRIHFIRSCSAPRQLTMEPGS
jgi:hypothetical protein